MEVLGEVLKGFVRDGSEDSGGGGSAGCGMFQRP